MIYLQMYLMVGLMLVVCLIIHDYRDSTPTYWSFKKPITWLFYIVIGLMWLPLTVFALIDYFRR